MSQARDCNVVRLDISYLYIRKKSGDLQLNNYSVIEGKH